VTKAIILAAVALVLMLSGCGSDSVSDARVTKLEQRVAKLEADKAALASGLERAWKEALHAGAPRPGDKTRVLRLENMLAVWMRWVHTASGQLSDTGGQR
jgi:outer membrane murein-binding lipoprotein Lpp